MGSIVVRGAKLYAKIKNLEGEWQRHATGHPNTPEGRRAVEAWIVKTERRLDAERAAISTGDATESLTVRRYSKSWLDKRREADLDWKNDRGRLEHHVIPMIGDKRLLDVRAKHLVDLFHKIRTTPLESTGKPLAQRSVYNVYSVVSALFRDAMLDGLIEATPCVLTERQLGPLVDSDPMWRSGALFTRDEAQTLISDERIAPDRRLVYALGLLAGMRPGEIAALRWSHYDPSVKPLGKLTIAFAHNTRKNRTKTTKTEAVRIVPVHSTLAALLAEWKLGGWAEMVGRQPEPDDLMLPLPPAAAKLRRSRDGEPIRTGDYMGKCWRERDLKMLGWRDRELYATKSTFITLAIEDGAKPDIIRDRVTHTKSKRDAFTGYDRGPHWIETCAEVAKLNIRRLSETDVITLPIAATGTASDDGTKFHGPVVVQSSETAGDTTTKGWRRRESNSPGAHEMTSVCCTLNNLCPGEFRSVLLDSAPSGRAWAERYLRRAQ